MFAYSQSQSSSVGATASPTLSYQGEGGSPVLSPGTGGRKRQRIPHDDRELSEIKRRMWGLRVHCDAVAEEREGEEGEEGEEGGGGSPMLVRSDSQDSAASASSTGSSTSGGGGGGAGRIDGDDPRALMLRTLYQRRRAPQTRAEAKIESLIRASLRRATAGGNLGGGESTASVMLPLALCDAPWRDVEQGRRAGGSEGSGGDMVRAAGGMKDRRMLPYTLAQSVFTFAVHHARPQDTSSSPSDFVDGPVPSPVAAVSSSSFVRFGATGGVEDDGGMEL